jgi:hypothetical protein
MFGIMASQSVISREYGSSACSLLSPYLVNALFLRRDCTIAQYTRGNVERNQSGTLKQTFCQFMLFWALRWPCMVYVWKVVSLDFTNP